MTLHISLKQMGRDCGMEFKITKGFDVALEGKPSDTITDLPSCKTVALYPLEFTGVRQRLLVEEGDQVTHGQALLENKTATAFKLRAPAGGTITEIRRGERRFVDRILIDVDDGAEAERFDRYTPEAIQKADRQAILDQLVRTGYLSFIRKRPFSHRADPEVRPKSIFVNAMNTAPYEPDAERVVADDPQAFQAGLDLLTRLTDGAVNLCIGDNAGDTLTTAERVAVSRFTGPHPAGNTSVHIAHVDPMKPTDVVWTVKAVDLVLLGRLFLDGTLPTSRIISVAGPGVRPDARHYYRLRLGGDLTPLLKTALEPGTMRLVNGNVLSGEAIPQDSFLKLHQSALTVLEEDGERHFLGWTMPGLDQMSFSRLFASSWLRPNRRWKLGTNTHGEERAMVLTGYYDRVVPLNIMVDYLVRAVLAGDTDEAIALGILETDPEDFALCDVICPSKVDVQNIIRDGLRQIEEEGI